jgi:hypothetical protein
LLSTRISRSKTPKELTCKRQFLGYPPK